MYSPTAIIHCVGVVAAFLHPSLLTRAKTFACIIEGGLTIHILEVWLVEHLIAEMVHMESIVHGKLICSLCDLHRGLPT